MPETNENNPKAVNPKKEWTIMFYFASDNPLAPGIISQLKAIKNAGYQHDVNVLTHFDPYNVGAPTHVFDVNIKYKLEDPKPNIGFGKNDPYVRNFLLDKLWRDEKTRKNHPIREEIKKVYGLPYDPPIPPAPKYSYQTDASYPEEPSPKDALAAFLKFGRECFPANHYMLFILGHGLIVANDVFLYDSNSAKESLTLVELGEILINFKQKVLNQNAQFEMVGFHSCSLSAAEVAYELRGTANYMLASQGPNFVGSWPYRSILIHIFNQLENWRRNRTEVKIEEMLSDIFYYCLHNSTDFLFAGYSFDLCLCNLNKVGGIKEPMKRLSEALMKGLRDRDPLIRDAILLAHWESQSYWQENYTDLYDFCFCLRRLCKKLTKKGKPMTGHCRDISRACWRVMRQLMKKGGSNQVIVQAEYAGPTFQYSHGLSVYFPWSRPADDIPIMEQYKSYEFSETRWLDFLLTYFKETQRRTRRNERHPGWPRKRPDNKDEAMLLEDIASLVYYSEGSLSGVGALSGKIGPTDPTGDDCGCASIKNFPRDTRALSERISKAGDIDGKSLIPLSPTFLDKYTR